MMLHGCFLDLLLVGAVEHTFFLDLLLVVGVVENRFFLDLLLVVENRFFLDLLLVGVVHVEHRCFLH